LEEYYEFQVSPGNIARPCEKEGEKGREGGREIITTALIYWNKNVNISNHSPYVFLNLFHIRSIFLALLTFKVWMLINKNH
jgi:hypothetical protein